MFQIYSLKLKSVTKNLNKSFYSFMYALQLKIILAFNLTIWYVC